MAEAAPRGNEPEQRLNGAIVSGPELFLIDCGEGAAQEGRRRMARAGKADLGAGLAVAPSVTSAAARIAADEEVGETIAKRLRPRIA